jgi:LPXTG-motif cell wall-anchored protein
MTNWFIFIGIVLTAFLLFKALLKRKKEHTPEITDEHYPDGEL